MRLSGDLMGLWFWLLDDVGVFSDAVVSRAYSLYQPTADVRDLKTAE